MTSFVQLASNALRSVGQSGITSFTQSGDAAVVANAKHLQIRDAVIRAFPWNFAKNRATLSKLAAAPDFGFAFQYQLPTSPYCLRVTEAL